MDRREVPISQDSFYDEDYGFPSDEELTALADGVFVMLDQEEERSTNRAEKP
jgi:hypothetical protein